MLLKFLISKRPFERAFGCIPAWLEMRVQANAERIPVHWPNSLSIQEVMQVTALRLDTPYDGWRKHEQVFHTRRFNSERGALCSAAARPGELQSEAHQVRPLWRRGLPHDDAVAADAHYAEFTGTFPRQFLLPNRQPSGKQGQARSDPRKALCRTIDGSNGRRGRGDRLRSRKISVGAGYDVE